MPIYAVEYSPKKDSYRIRPWETMIEENGDAIKAGEQPEFFLLNIANSYKEARKLADLHALTLPNPIPNL
jgi:hypothetical protein